MPVVFVVWSGAQLDAAAWQSLWSARLPRLFANTLSLAAWVALGALIVGVSTAWLVARFDFPGRGLAVWLMALPLAIPSYVLAYLYTELSPAFYGMAGAVVVLTIAGFPYVFLLALASLSSQSRSLDDAARTAGLSSAARFFRVTLPMLRPALAAATAIVVLHTLADFGAVSLLRVQTFTLAVYQQMTGRFDYHGAAGLSIVLVTLTLTLLVIERFFRRRQRHHARAGRTAHRRRLRGASLAGAWAWLGLVAMVSVGIPVAWMVLGAVEAIARGVVGPEFIGYARNSVVAATGAAATALVLALPVAWYHARRPGVASASALQVASVGFVLPGPVVALGVLVAVVLLAGPVYGTLAALVAALTIRFLPLAVQTQESSLQQLTPSVFQAARTLGAGALETLTRVGLPMMRRGLAVAFVLVFIDALKELPATLLLRPVGFDTLAVRIWIESSEEMLHLAAPAALTLVAASLPAIWLIVRADRSG